MMDINTIKRLCKAEAMRWSNHIMHRLHQRKVSMDDVISAVMNSELIEEYLDDYPYPSCLLMGLDAKGCPIHVVCGIAPTELRMITVYRPDPAEWSHDFKTRKECQT